MNRHAQVGFSLVDPGRDQEDRAVMRTPEREWLRGVPSKDPAAASHDAKWGIKEAYYEQIFSHDDNGS
ncbi:hypothetical protein DL764_004893 [Monosporascus ibericus]|uniref:Uncharacterized protein n=1 Tax=Monosporascus ibericus TaxID=155417 RepID=A0A4Q4TAX3_9PEZI|nr:hypothetical protein DL764_004893 [Monosporascus ibericus]